MRKAILSLLCIWILLSVVAACKENPTLPEFPTKKAKITVEVADWPFELQDEGGVTIWSFDVIVSESNGVGGRISKAQAQIYLEDGLKSQDTVEGERFEPFGSLTIHFYFIDYTPEAGADKLTIIVEGGDDNGFPFKESVSYEIEGY